MIYYGLAAIFPLFCWFIDWWWKQQNQLNKEDEKKVKKWLTVLAVLPMFLLFVFRYKYVGADTIGYVRFFQTEIRKYSFIQLLDQDLLRVEIGYRLYVKIISLFTSNYTVYFFINGTIIFGTLLRLSLKYTKNPFVFFFVFINNVSWKILSICISSTIKVNKKCIELCYIFIFCSSAIRNKKQIFLTIIFGYLFNRYWIDTVNQTYGFFISQ